MTDYGCPSCGVPLADDQRYCLNCGNRVGDGRDHLLRTLAPPPPPPAPPAPVVERVGPRLWSPLGGGVLVALLLVGLLGGVALAGDEEREPTIIRVAAPPAPDVRVNVAGGGGPVEEAEFVSDWPGDDGWTVQLQALPKEGSTVADVDAAKASAESQGAPDVGALDSDEWPSLDGGDYVVYSGVFTSKKEAAKALKKLRKDFPDAEVVEVSAGGGATKIGKDTDKQSDEELEDLQEATGEEYVKKSKKLPDKVATEGKKPKPDNKKPGGGSDATVLE
jgi:hypothetical protein